mmetsp:Transcript_6508/g.18718  ORF Transcript_6508/g.18718 Transcript_6508/m.18718 type:complete len:265 (+) Transcript_6508:309-1103(+)
MPLHAADAQARQPLVQTLQQHARLAHSLTCHVATAGALLGYGGRGCIVGAALESQLGRRLDDVENGPRPCCLKILDVGACQAASSEGCIQALSGEVQELLEVRVHHDLLLKAVLERFGSRQRATAPRGCGGASAQPGNVASQHIQQHGFCDVICVVARHDAVRLCEDSSPIQSLSPQHTTVRAIILGADLPHDVVHRPPVQLLVGDHRERYAILDLILLHRGQRVISVATDPLVYRQQEKVPPRIVSPVESGQHVCKYGGVLAA